MLSFSFTVQYFVEDGAEEGALVVEYDGHVDEQQQGVDGQTEREAVGVDELGGGEEEQGQGEVAEVRETVLYAVKPG